MNEARRIYCLESHYDREDAMLTLHVRIEDTNEHKIIYTHKDDVSKSLNLPMEDNDVEFFAKQIVGKTFNWVLEDDPNRVQMDESQQEEYAKKFRAEIKSELDKVTDGLLDSDKQLERHLDRLISQERARRRM
jgi:hypothetical protein